MVDNDACEEVEVYIENGKEISSWNWQACYTCNTDHINDLCGIGTSPNNEASNDEAKSVVEVDDTVEEQDSWDIAEEQEEDDNKISSSELKMLVLNLGNYNEWDDNGDNSWPHRLQRIGDFIVNNT